MSPMKGDSMRYLFGLLVLTLVLVSCGSAPEAAAPTAAPVLPTVAPTDAPKPTSVPTEAPKPTIQPTAKPITGAGLGITRAELQAKFEGAPFNVVFSDASDAKGPAVRGTSPTKGIEVLLRGPAEDVQEAQIQATIGDQGAPAADILRHMIALLEVAAPEINEPTIWLKPHLDQALSTGSDVAIEGKRIVTLLFAREINYLLLSVQPAP